MKMVADASAILCVILDEPGAEAAAPLLPGATVSAVNLCEVFTRLSDGEADHTASFELIAKFEFTVVPFDADQAAAAARLREATRHLGLSLGDRACLALAAARGMPAMTADRVWAGLDLGIPIRVIR